MFRQLYRTMIYYLFRECRGISVDAAFLLHTQLYSYLAMDSVLISRQCGLLIPNQHSRVSLVHNIIKYLIKKASNQLILLTNSLTIPAKLIQRFLYNRASNDANCKSIVICND
jgi:hypothetical protein